MSILIGIAAVGCSSTGAAPSGNDGQIRVAMKLLGLEHGAYLASYGKVPADADALRSFLQSWE